MLNTHLLPTTFCPKFEGTRAPSIVPDESIIFFMHRVNPLGILESSSNSAGFNGNLNYGAEAIFRVQFDDVIFRAGLHGMMV